MMQGSWGRETGAMLQGIGTAGRSFYGTLWLRKGCCANDDDDNYKTATCIFFSHIYRASWYYQSVCIHQLMHKWTVFKTILKFTLKQLRHVSVQSHHYQGAHYSCFLKLQMLKYPIQILRCVVMWLHMLVDPCWCLYVALFGSSLL
jgi:hypothetical protein